MYVCMYLYKYVCMYVCMYICMRTFVLSVPHTVLVYSYLGMSKLELRILCHQNDKN